MSNLRYTVTLPNQKSITFSKHNERLIIVNPTDTSFEKKQGSGENTISGLNYYGELDIDINAVLTLKEKHKYKILEIVKESTNGFAGPGYYLYIQPQGLSRSSTFIMPFIGHTQQDLRYNNEFINCFIGTEADGDYGSNIYLLYRYSGTLEFARFEDQLLNHPLYEETIEVDKFQTLYSFRIPEDKKDDIDKIIKGQYSKISENSKQRILDFNSDNHPNSTLHQILYKSRERRIKMEYDYDCIIPEDNELLSPFDPEKEIFMNRYIIT